MGLKYRTIFAAQLSLVVVRELASTVPLLVFRGPQGFYIGNGIASGGLPP